MSFRYDLLLDDFRSRLYHLNFWFLLCLDMLDGLIVLGFLNLRNLGCIVSSGLLLNSFCLSEVR